MVSHNSCSEMRCDFGDPWDGVSFVDKSSLGSSVCCPASAHGKGRSCLLRSMYLCLPAEHSALFFIHTPIASFHRYIHPSPAFIVTYAQLHLSSLRTPVTMFIAMNFLRALIAYSRMGVFVFWTVTQINPGGSLWVRICWLVLYLPACCFALILSTFWVVALGRQEYPDAMGRLFRAMVHVPPNADYGFPW